MIALTLAAYWPACRALWDYWGGDWGDLGSHGILVIAIALCLLIRARGRVIAAPGTGLPALLLLIPASVAALVFWKSGIQTLQLLMLPVLILLGALAGLGSAATRAIALPVAFIYFAMPGWGFLVAPLQALTLWGVSWLAPAIGIPATVSGSLILLPGELRFEVAPWCSGVQFLIDGLAVAVLLGELEQASTGRRLRLVASMVPVTIAANWIRVLALVELGYATQMRNSLVTSHHLLFGYVLFVLVLVAFVWLATRRLPPEAAQAAPEVPASSPRSAAYIAALLALAAPPAVLGLLTVLRAGQAEPRELRLPPGRAGWSGPANAADAYWRPAFVGPHTERRGTYRGASGSVEVVAVGYDTQAQGRELVNEGNAPYRGLTAESTGVVLVDHTHYREQLVRDGSGRRSVIWSLYVIGDHPFTTPLFAQLWYGMNAFGTPPHSAWLAYRSACDDSCSGARGALSAFVRALGPQLLAAPEDSTFPQLAAVERHGGTCATYR